jgi:hypothetical protein
VARAGLPVSRPVSASPAGLFQVITSIAYRKAMPSSWGWLLASGLCDLIFERAVSAI